MSGLVDILFSSDTIGCFEGSENMYLAEFIQLLYNVIGNGITQTKFTETILKNITSNEDLIDYSDSSYKNFFHGKTEVHGSVRVVVDDYIGKLKIRISSSLDQGKFERYLNSVRFNIEAKKQLCNYFKKQVPDINLDNVTSKLAELLVKILSVANDSNTTKTHATIIPESVRKTICELLENIYSEIEILQCFPYNALTQTQPSMCLFNSDGQSEDIEKLNAEAKADFNKHFMSFYTLNKKLQLYVSMYPQLTILSEMIERSDFISELDFGYSGADDNPRPVDSDLINYYKELLRQGLAELNMN